MGSDWDIIGKEGLQFFGKMSASISHEIKNVLAIINENAGLLEDFTLMAEKGRPIDMERFKTVAGKIRGQVGRADGIVKNLSRFAHSSDDFTGEIDLNELLGFVMSLSNRFATMVDVSFEHMEADRPVLLNTTPFILQNLLWLCLNFAMEVVDGECPVIGSLYVEQYLFGSPTGEFDRERFAQALDAAYQQTDGLMIFDLVHLGEQGVWDVVEEFGHRVNSPPTSPADDPSDQ